MIKRSIYSIFVSMVMVCLFTISNDSVLAAPPVTLSDNQSIIPLTGHISYFRDTTNTGSFFQARAHFNKYANVAPPSEPNIQLMGTNAIYWFDVNLMNTSSINEWVMSWGNPFQNNNILAKRIYVFDKKGDGTPIEIYGNANEVNATLYEKAIPLNLKTGQRTDILIMVETMNKVPFRVNPRLVSMDEFHARTTAMRSIRYGLLIGLGALAGLGIALYLTSHITALFIAPFYLISLWGYTILKSGQYDLLATVAPMMLINAFIILLPALITIFAAMMTYVLFADQKKGIGGYIFILGALVIAAIPMAVFILPVQNAALSAAYQMIFVIMAIVIGGFSLIALLSSRRWMALYTLPWCAFFLSMTDANPFLTLALHTILLIGFLAFYMGQKMVEHHTGQRDIRRELENTMHEMQTKFNEEKKRLEKIQHNERGMLQDLRRRDAERAHELKVARANADAANQSKSDFLAMISHEIRTPMTGIMGMIQLLLDTSMNDQQREYTETIKYSGETLLTLLNDILDFSKIESGHLELEIVHFDIRRLSQSVALLMSGRAHEKGLDINVAIDDSVPQILKGDPTRIRQILLNLLSNAIKFTDDGHITLSITPKATNNNNNDEMVDLHFAVTDTGTGISEEGQTKLFTAYAQEDASISRRYGGTGLGLNICKKLVEAMNGAIGVQSTLNEGSTFWFNLALSVGDDDHAVNDDSFNSDNKKLSPLNILSVDDNTINLKVLDGLLSRDGHTVTSVESGKDALAAIEDNTFDVILMDMKMAGMNGPDTSRYIRNLPDPEKAKTPIIAMTANTLKDDIDQCRDAGMNSFLSKPVLREALIRVLYNVTHGNDRFDMADSVALPTEPKQSSEDNASSSPNVAPSKDDTPASTPTTTPPKDDIEMPEAKPATIEKKADNKTDHVETRPTRSPSPPSDPQANLSEKKTSTMHTLVNKKVGELKKKMTTFKEKTVESKTPKTNKKNDQNTTNKADKPSKSKEDNPQNDKQKKEDKQSFSLKDAVDDLKDETFSFYKKARASIKLGMDEDGLSNTDLENLSEGKTTTDTHEHEPIDDDRFDFNEEEEFSVQSTEDKDDDGKNSTPIELNAKDDIPVLNVDMINDLYSSLGMEAMDDMYKDLFKKAREIHDMAKGADQYGDADDASERGHELKGMAGNFGLTKLSAYGNSLEQAGLKQDKARVHALMSEFDAVYDETETAINQWRDQHKSS